VGDRLGDAVIFLAIVGVIAVVGVRVGMLVAPRIGRLAGDPDEDPVAEADGVATPTEARTEETRDDD
jgi:hypothetical protein